MADDSFLYLTLDFAGLQSDKGILQHVGQPSVLEVNSIYPLQRNTVTPADSFLVPISIANRDVIRAILSRFVVVVSLELEAQIQGWKEEIYLHTE